MSVKLHARVANYNGMRIARDFVILTCFDMITNFVTVCKTASKCHKLHYPYPTGVGMKIAGEEGWGPFLEIFLF
jgi:hypothetical protein